MSESDRHRAFCWVCQSTQDHVHEILYINLKKGIRFEIGACEKCIARIDENPDLDFGEILRTRMR